MKFLDRLLGTVAPGPSGKRIMVRKNRKQRRIEEALARKAAAAAKRAKHEKRR